MVLDRRLYGERDASVEFNDFQADIYEDIGFERCPQQPQFYFNRTTSVLAEIHQDDVHAAGPDDGLRRMMDLIGSRLMMKWSDLIGPGQRYSFLKNNRLVLPEGVFIYPNPRYANDIIKTLGMQNAKSAPTPIIKLRQSSDGDDPIKDDERIWIYRHCVSVARFLRNYKPEVNFAVKELSHGLQAPTEEDYKRLKHFARFLIGSRDFGIFFPAAGDDHEVAVSTDSDWAQDKITRKSTSCYNIMVDGCLLADASKQQSVQAQSSGEAEVYGAVSGVSPGILIVGVLQWLKYRVVRFVLNLDSKAAKAIITRLGVGGVRHLEVKILWTRRLAKIGVLKVMKVPGEANHADVGTKVLPRERFYQLLRMMNVKRVADAEGAPEAKAVGAIKSASNVIATS